VIQLQYTPQVKTTAELTLSQNMHIDCSERLLNMNRIDTE